MTLACMMGLPMGRVKISPRASGGLPNTLIPTPPAERSEVEAL